MKKIVNPAMCDVYGSKKSNAFARIEYNDGRLSICGVIGPMSNGNCIGSAGQCYDEILEGTPTGEWTSVMLKKFIDIWKRWHLNDMRPTCEHQRELGWEKEASEEVTIYHYRLTTEARKAKEAAEKAALEALRQGVPFTPSEEQVKFATLPSWTETYAEELVSPYYEPQKPLYAGDTGATEKKTRGWIRYDETPIGILCKPCPVCGYKYGSSWNQEEVPKEVIDWLFSLPDAKTRPAWV